MDEDDNEDLMLRRALKIRRTVAMQHADRMIELWNDLFAMCSIPIESSDKALSSLSDSNRDYNPYSCKRRLCSLLIRNLYQLWAHPKLNVLTPELVQSMLETMQTGIKSLQDVKIMAFTLQNSSIRSLSRPTASRPPDEAVISQVQEMGFSRNAILRAIQRLEQFPARIQSNFASQLTEHLLENDYSDEPLPEPAAVASVVPTSTSSNQESNVGNGILPICPKISMEDLKFTAQVSSADCTSARAQLGNEL
jgi:hypothetical protein